MNLGIYESLITQALQKKLSVLDHHRFFIAEDKKLDAEEAVYFLTAHLSTAIANALRLIKVDKKELLVSKQIEISNRILQYVTVQISQYDFNDDLIDAEGRILEAVLDQLKNDYTDLKLHLQEIMPVSRLTQSELFTGGNVGLSLDSELKKEIRSADRIDLLVSFIKWKAIVILREAFEEFTARGGQLRVITTTYMGASDARAIDELSQLPNTQVKVSYNNANERLHAKAYLFFRDTGFHTGYIGSSNFSRSALTDGLEWNVKVTTKEIPHIINKFQKTFESYWNAAEFEAYDATKLQQLDHALKNNKIGKSTLEIASFFDLKPYHYQAEILEKLRVERAVHGSYKNLIVAATGTGKTMISAFDFKNFRQAHPDAKVLFVAHRIEILKQALHTFRNVLKDQNFGELWGDGYVPNTKSAVFATIQTLNNQDLVTFCTPDYYDFIVIDEAHHSTASTYRKAFSYFTPKIWEGLTATPERMDSNSILPDFNFRIAAEIRLPDALNQKLLCPFQYFGITDSVDYSKVGWTNGQYNVSELSRLLTSGDLRTQSIIQNLNKYTRDIHEVTALGFCVSIDHAQYMSQRFQQAGLQAAYLVSENAAQRTTLLHQLQKHDINYLFVVDIFNEGIDIPEIDTVLFLRPTESLTIFLQQLGRGLRLHENKDVLTVLDFVGNARPEYDFENKFRALIGKTNTTVKHEIERDFPNLPLGSSIVLEKQAKEFILDNVRKATDLNKRRLIQLLQNYQNQTDLPLTLSNFITIYNLNLKQIYKNYTFSILKAEAFNLSLDTKYYEWYKTMLGKKWMVTESLSYFQFILAMITNNFDLSHLADHQDHQQMGLMLYYDFYQKPVENETLAESLKKIGENKDMVQEMQELIEVKISQIDFEELPFTNLPYGTPLRIHARYTRDQIFAALQMSTLQRKNPGREGVAENKALHTEALFVNLKKSEEDFSPTTMYDDYAINEVLFHWQSQNQTAPESPKGQSYIRQKEQNKIVLLFIRESRKDAHGYTQGYVCIGPVNFVESTGTKPMSITWQLQEPMSNYLWKESAKLVAG